MRPGDVLFFSFSGYGLLVDDMDGYQDEVCCISSEAAQESRASSCRIAFDAHPVD